MNNQLNQINNQTKDARVMTTENDARLAQQRYNALADSILWVCNSYPSDKNVPVFVTVGSRIHSMLCALNNGKAFVQQHTMILDSKISVHLDQTLHHSAIVVHGIYDQNNEVGDDVLLKALDFTSTELERLNVQ